MSDQLLERTVTLLLNDQPISLVLEALARQLEVEVHRQNEGLYFVGALRPEDRAVLVRRVRGLRQQEIRRAVGTLVGNGSAVEAFNDGLLVVSDKAAVLARVDELVDGIEAAGRPAWAVQLYLITLTGDDLRELGMDVTPSLDVGVTYASAASGGVSVDAAAGLQAVLRAAREQGESRVVAEPFFYLVDGDEGQFQRVRELAVPVTTTTENGVQLRTGYQPFRAGTEVVVGIREVRADAVLLTCKVDLAELRSVSAEGFPESDARRFQASSVCYSGGVYLVGAIDISEVRQARGTWLHWGQRAETSQEVLQIWARVVSVDSKQGGARL